MKFYTTLIIILFSSAYLQAQLQTPALSPGATLKQTVGLTDIEVQYSRPSVKGRTVFGAEGLLPYGEFWRAGANAATKFTFDQDITLAQKPLAKGSYTLLVKPHESEWNFYIYPYTSGTWTHYVHKEPLHTFKIATKQVEHTQETFEIAIENISTDQATLDFAFENVLVSVPLKVEVKDKVLAYIDRTMEGPSNFDYYQAALFLHENDIDDKRALQYIQKATTSDNALFFMVHREALILKDLGQTAQAKKAAQRALQLAKEAGNNDFVRLNNQLLAQLK